MKQKFEVVFPDFDEWSKRILDANSHEFPIDTLEYEIAEALRQSFHQGRSLGKLELYGLGGEYKLIEKCSEEEKLDYLAVAECFSKDGTREDT